MELNTKQPKGLWYGSWSNSISSVGFGIISSLLVLYVTEQFKFTSAEGYSLYGAYMSQLFTFPLIGGFVAGLLGYKRALLTGYCLQICGLIALLFGDIYMAYLGLSLFVSGIALNVPSLYVIIGKIYAKEDGRRETGFTYMYTIMNVGFIIGGVSGGYIQQCFGYNGSFLFGAVMMILALIIFISGIKHYNAYQGRTFEPKYTQLSNLKATLMVIVVGILLVPFSVLLLVYSDVNNVLLVVLAVLVAIYLIYVAFSQDTVQARNKVIAFLLLSVISIGFWSLYMLEPSLLTEFIKYNVDRDIFGSMVPPSVFYSLDPIIIVLFGALFAQFWAYLSRHNKNLSLPMKFTIGIFLMSFGFLLLRFVVSLHAVDAQTSAIWIVGAYLFLTFGELFVGPIGIAMVGRLSPEGSEGMFMGIWQLFTGISAGVSVFLADFAIIPKGNPGLSVTNPIYMSAFGKIGIFCLVLAFLSLALYPFIKKIMK
jgi:POT family proton-dependent oligopeptide transporter